MRTVTRTWLRCLVGALCLPLCLPFVAARAAPLRALVVDQRGTPIPDAVVYAEPVDGKLPPPKRPQAVIDQIKRRFVPLVSVVRTGTAVTFPNKDNIEHDVYSFSPAKRFELHLYHGVPAKPVMFDKPGLVVMGCNIHDQMIAYLLVVDTPWFAKTDAHGEASIDDVPPHTYKLTVWHYRMLDPDRLPSRNVAAGSGGPARFTLQLKSE
ncbi:methylamine utilization protein [Trinickia fusca]|uniref:methylamine utilization protein n=1 Tax=Trinickia fusca TaxID=2419777 RepID=UPI0015FFA8DE|nr:methylamine utilization protein [Trinickia fusca]